MKNIIPLAILLLTLSSCNKNYEERNVRYLITGLNKPYKVSYLDEKGETVSEKITPTGVAQKWKIDFTAKQGDLVYLFTEFYEMIDHKTFQVAILIDGKIYKDAYGYNHNQADTLFRVVCSGVVPY